MIFFSLNPAPPDPDDPPLPTPESLILVRFGSVQVRFGSVFRSVSGPSWGVGRVGVGSLRGSAAREKNTILLEIITHFKFKAINLCNCNCKK